MEEEFSSLPSKSNFSEWYNNLLWKAEIMDVRYPVKGLYVWYPHGFAIRKEVYNMLRELLNREHQETLFPLLIPETEFMKEAEHIKGFENEVYWVTKGGNTELDIPLALRPTSETAIYPMYALWVRSHADLPIKMYQIVNTFRYETKHTRPLIRLREITSFKEAHTVHATWEEAEEQVYCAVDLYVEFYNKLCIPVIVSKRPDWDKFPGADYTIAIDTVMPDGKTLQIGTVHHLGDHFSRTFNITYEDERGQQQYAQQTCYGISERSIAALISVHGDDRGLVLPPSIAPIQIVIIPVVIGMRREEILNHASQLEFELKEEKYRVKNDFRDMRPGAKYYYWEMKGVPLRLEIGPRDIDSGKVTVVARDGVRSIIDRKDVKEAVKEQLEKFEQRLRTNAERHLRNSITIAKSIEESALALEKGVAIIRWCGANKCAKILEDRTGGSVLGKDISSSMIDQANGSCIVCEKEGYPTLLANAY